MVNDTEKMIRAFRNMADAMWLYSSAFANHPLVKDIIEASRRHEEEKIRRKERVLLVDSHPYVLIAAEYLTRMLLHEMFFLDRIRDDEMPKPAPFIGKPVLDGQRRKDNFIPYILSNQPFNTPLKMQSRGYRQKKTGGEV